MVKNCLLQIVALLATSAVYASFVPVTLTGFNHDIVANGIGNASASSTIAVDDPGSNFCLVAPDFKAVSTNAPPLAALPANGVINSLLTSGLSYQLAQYSGSNALVISALNGSGQLNFTGGLVGDVYVLGCTGSGVSTATITVRFTDNTTQVFTGINFADWFYATPFAFSGFGRVNRTSNALEAPAGDPRFYENKLTLSPANYSKQIAGITVTKTSSTGILNIVAVSVCTAPKVTAGPMSSTICEGSNAMVSIAGNNVSSYQWQVDAGSGFVNVTNNATYSGATTPTLSIANVPGSFDGNIYRCVVRSACGLSLNSGQATLAINSNVAVTAHTLLVNACENAYSSMQIGTSGTINTYQWQIGTVTSGFTDIQPQFPYTGANADKLEIAVSDMSLQGLSFRCIINGNCNADTSDPIPMNISPTSHFLSNPVNDTVQPYENGLFQSSIGGGPYGIYWQASTDDGAHFVNINDNALYHGTKSNTLTVNSPAASLDGMKFRSVLVSTDPLCNGYKDTSDMATLVIRDPLGIPGIATKQVLMYPNPATGNHINIRTGMVNTELQIIITNAVGAKMLSKTVSADATGSFSVPLSGFSSGIYFLRITGTDVQGLFQKE